MPLRKILALALVTLSPIVPAVACDGVASLGYGAGFGATYATTAAYATPTYVAAAQYPVLTGAAITQAACPVQTQVAIEQPPTLAATVLAAQPTYVAAATPIYAAQQTTVLAATPTVAYASPLLYAGGGYGNLAAFHSYGHNRAFFGNTGLGYGNLGRAAFVHNNRAAFGNVGGIGGYGGFGNDLSFRQAAFLRQRNLAATPVRGDGLVVQQRREGGIVPGIGRAVFGQRVVGEGVNRRGQFAAPTRRNFARGGF